MTKMTDLNAKSEMIAKNLQELQELQELPDKYGL